MSKRTSKLIALVIGKIRRNKKKIDEEVGQGGKCEDNRNREGGPMDWYNKIPRPKIIINI